MTPARRMWLGVLAATGVIGGTIGTVVVWRAHATRAAIVAQVPARPDLAGRPTALAARVAAAEARALQGDAAGLAELSRLYHANGFYREALWCYDGLMAVEPTNPVWWDRAAHLRAEFGEGAAARPLLERVVQLAPDFLPARIKWGEVLLKNNELDAAQAVFAAVLERDADNTYALIDLARIDVARGDWAAARPRLERVAMKTNFAFGADLLTTVYEQLGEEARARGLRSRQKHHGAYQAVSDPWINQLNDDGFDPYQLSLESGAASYRGDDADAMRWIGRALELDPTNGQLHHQAARLWEKLHDQVKAKAEYEKAVELDPQIGDAWARLITLYKAIGETGPALRALRNGLEANPDSGVLLVERGRAYKERGRLDDALADFQRVTALRHDDATAYIEAAQVLFQLERNEEGVAMLLGSLEAEPENPFGLMMLCFTAITRHDRPAADAWFARVAAQPRVTAADRGRLAATYQQEFGAAPAG